MMAYAAVLHSCDSNKNCSFFKMILTALNAKCSKSSTQERKSSPARKAAQISHGNKQDVSPILMRTSIPTCPDSLIIKFNLIIKLMCSMLLMVAF